MIRLRKFRSLSGPEKLCFCEAGFLLLLSTLCIKTIPFKHIDRYLREHWTKASQDVWECTDLIKLVEASVSRAAKVWPFESRCLSRSVTTYIMLRRRNVPAILFTGVKVSNDSSLHAHAWVGIVGDANDKHSTIADFIPLLRIEPELVDN